MSTGIDYSKLVVTRNDVTQKMVKAVFSKKSPHAGKEFPTFEFSEPELDNAVKFFGRSEVAALLTGKVRAIVADIFIDFVEEHGGVFTPDLYPAYLEEVADFTAGVTKLGDLQEEIEQLQTLQSTYVNDEQFGATNEDGTPTERAAELIGLMKETAKKIQPLRVQIAGIKEVYKQRAAKREAKKNAEKAAVTA